MKLSFVIPCYRSEKTIAAVVGEIKSVVETRKEYDYEIVMVSDHSPDNVYNVIEAMCRCDPQHLKGLELARNFGQQSALMAGYAASGGDVIISLDDDGQSPVDAIYSLVDRLREDADVVIGSYEAKKHNVFRNLGSWVNSLMTTWLLDKPMDIQMTSFFAMRRFVADAVLSYEGPYPYLGGLLFRVTRNIVNVPVKHRARAEGASGYTFAKLLGLWLNGFTAFSVKPLRLASWAGFICAAMGFFYGFWTVINKLFINNDAPIGYSSVMSAVLFIGGTIMLILGLIGEYIGRIYISINKSPQYVISRKTTT
ncbi:MAG: glycosyltransferase family 2 protein [Kiritimatiellae bacterium]|nr:glycosyltransferase family 2 protein [Kiritimatiellia bacterium]